MLCCSVAESGLLPSYFCTHRLQEQLTCTQTLVPDGVSAQVVLGGGLCVLGTRDWKSVILSKLPLKGGHNRRGSWYAGVSRLNGSYRQGQVPWVPTDNSRN